MKKLTLIKFIKPIKDIKNERPAVPTDAAASPRMRQHANQRHYFTRRKSETDVKQNLDKRSAPPNFISSPPLQSDSLFNEAKTILEMLHEPEPDPTGTSQDNTDVFLSEAQKCLDDANNSAARPKVPLLTLDKRSGKKTISSARKNTGGQSTTQIPSESTSKNKLSTPDISIAVIKEKKSRTSRDGEALTARLPSKPLRVVVNEIWVVAGDMDELDGASDKGKAMLNSFWEEGNNNGLVVRILTIDEFLARNEGRDDIAIAFRGHGAMNKGRHTITGKSKRKHYTVDLLCHAKKLGLGPTSILSCHIGNAADEIANNEFLMNTPNAFYALHGGKKTTMVGQNNTDTLRLIKFFGNFKKNNLPWNERAFLRRQLHSPQSLRVIVSSERNSSEGAIGHFSALKKGKQGEETPIKQRLKESFDNKMISDQMIIRRFGIQTATLKYKKKDYEAALIQRANYGDIESVIHILKINPKININARNIYGENALIAAYKNKQWEVVDFLMKKKNINYNQVDQYGLSMLGLAIHYKDKDMIDALLQKADIDVNAQAPGGGTVLLDACMRGKLDQVKFLLSKPGVDVNKPNEYGNTPLLLACAYGQDKVVLELLQAPGLELNKSDKFGTTPLEVAREHCSADVVKTMESLGAKTTTGFRLRGISDSDSDSDFSLWG